MRRKTSFFSGMHDTWEPIYDSGPDTSCRHIGPLPEWIHYEENGGTIECQGIRAKREEEIFSIREGGPDAWGASLNLDPCVLFRWLSSRDGTGDWYVTTRSKHITISTGGRWLETIEATDDDRLKWTLYYFDVM